jgi:predicted HTH transcriptional regulator
MRVEDRIKDLCEARLIIPRGDGDFDVTNLGAVLFAHDLAEFRLERKALRIISYRGVDRLDWQDEYIERSGYAAGFRTILEKIEHALPKRETLVRQLRRLVPIYPMDAIRELVANALIHQDFSMTGTGPMVEIFKDRVQVTNPGSPLVEPERFIDKRRSRNEATALAMRHLKICEERGSGIDRVIKLIEDARMPAPLFRRDVDHTEATLLAPKAWEEMTPDDRVRACFQHAALLFEQKAYLSNGSLRERFALEASRASALSRVISDTVRAGKIVKVNDAAGKRHVKYQPFYAAEFLFQDDVEHDDDAT